MPTFEQIQARLEGFTPLRFALTNAKIRNLSHLIHNFFIRRFQTYDEKGHIQCQSNKRRTKEDFYLLLKTYHPSITLREASKIVNRLKIRGILSGGEYCYDTHRNVYNPASLSKTEKEITEALAEMDLSEIKSSILERSSKNFDTKFKEGKKKTPKRKKTVKKEEDDGEFAYEDEEYEYDEEEEESYYGDDDD